MTKDSTTKKKKVTFALPDSESESECKDKPFKNRNRKATPPKPKFEPPPLDLDIKVRPILKNKLETPVYEAPRSTTSLLPLHIINSIINAQFGPDIPDDSGSEKNTPDACDISPKNLFTLNKNKNNLNNNYITNGESESHLIDDNLEENIDVWFLNSENQKPPASFPPLKNELKQKSCGTKETESLNNSLNKQKKQPTLQRSDSSSSETSESTDSSTVSKLSSDKPKTNKPRRKLKVSINIEENGTETESSETYEIELGSKASPEIKDNSQKNSGRILEALKVSEVNYLDLQCEDKFNSDSPVPQNTAKTSQDHLLDALSYANPVIVEPEAPLPLRVSQSTYYYFPCEETFDLYSTLPRRLARRSSEEYQHAIVCNPLRVLYHSIEDEAQPVKVGETTHLDYYCEEYSDSELVNLILLRTLPQTTSSVDLCCTVVALPPVIVQTLRELKQQISVPEIGYIDCFCDEYLKLSDLHPRTLVIEISLEHPDALTTLPPPLLVQNYRKEEVEVERTEPKRTLKTRRKSSVHFADLPDTEDKENLHQSFDFVEKKDEAQTLNGGLHSLILESNNLPLSSRPDLSDSPTESSSAFEGAEERSNSTLQSTNPFLKRPLRPSTNKGSNKHIITSVKLHSDFETNRLPTQRILKPYQRKPRQPLALIMDGSQDLNCAGDPETLSPHKVSLQDKANAHLKTLINECVCVLGRS